MDNNPHLQSTQKCGPKFAISFLVICNSLQTVVKFNWFHKVTFSGRVLNFLAHHPVTQKRLLVYYLVDKRII